ncbi:MAG TPA: helix-turn-helix domain-containing protein [Frankiaceae bacterium]|jgi:AcrR family transcriptional regulator|nr:helix-turn-helix domain-containing protein [Frankiaceae bacterium]
MADAKQALLRAGEELFARDGINGARINELTDRAGQRNQSALHYHFRSREGLLAAIVERHLSAVDGVRAQLLVVVGPQATLRQLVAVIVTPLAGELATSSGRDYLRIVPQILKSDVSPPALLEAMGLAEAHLARLEEPVRKERLRALIQVATTLLAARAVAIEEGEKLLLAEPAFVANVTEMCTAMLEAPWDRTT